METNFAGSIHLFRFILRKSWLYITIWLLGISCMTLIVPLSFSELYPTQQARDVMAETMRNPAMTAMVGPGHLENYTIGAMVSHQMLLLTSVAVAIMNFLLIVKHTRAEEEDGRTELLSSLPISRKSQLVAALFVLLPLNMLLAVLIGFGLFGLGIEDMNLAGSLWYGAVLGASGLFFGGVAAVCSQLLESSRSAIGLSFTFMLITFLLRTSGQEWLTWTTPFGLVTLVQPFSVNNGWPVLLLVTGFLLLTAFAMALHHNRDIGAGFLPSKAGRAHASIFLRQPLGLAWRLQRTAFWSWGVGMLVLGLAYGSILGDLEDFFATNEMLTSMLISDSGSTLAAQFLPMLMVVLALISSIPALLALNKLQTEENKSRLDLVLSRTVSKRMLMASYLIVALFNGIIMLGLSSIGLWIASHTVMEDPFSLGTLLGVSFAHLPALMILIAISACLIGFYGKKNYLVWLYVLYSFVVIYFGGLFQLPGWMEKLTPFGYVSKLPIEEMNWLNIVGMLVMTIVLLAVSFDRYMKRDLQG